MIKIGDKLPAGKLQEFVEIEGDGCSIGPNAFDIEQASAGKTIGSVAASASGRLCGCPDPFGSFHTW